MADTSFSGCESMFDKHNIPVLSRRELLRIGGISVVGGFVNAFKPTNVKAAQRVQPMATARQVIFVNIAGGADGEV